MPAHATGGAPPSRPPPPPSSAGPPGSPAPPAANGDPTASSLARPAAAGPPASPAPVAPTSPAVAPGGRAAWRQSRAWGCCFAARDCAGGSSGSPVDLPRGPPPLGIRQLDERSPCIVKAGPGGAERHPLERRDLLAA